MEDRNEPRDWLNLLSTWREVIVVFVLFFPIIAGVVAFNIPSVGNWLKEWSPLLTGYFSLIFTLALVVLYFQQKRILANQDRPVVVVNDLYLNEHDELPYFLIELSNAGTASARNIEIEIIPQLLTSKSLKQSYSYDEDDVENMRFSDILSPTRTLLSRYKTIQRNIPLHESYLQPQESEHLTQMAALNLRDPRFQDEDFQRMVWGSALDTLASLDINKLRLRFILHYDGPVQSYSDSFLDYVIPVEYQMDYENGFNAGLPYSRYQLNPDQLQYDPPEE